MSFVGTDRKGILKEIAKDPALVKALRSNSENSALYTQVLRHKDPYKIPEIVWKDFSYAALGAFVELNPIGLPHTFNKRD